MAIQLGLSRVSARRYLEYLVIHGFARLTPRYGAAGRPENRYCGSVEPVLGVDDAGAAPEASGRRGGAWIRRA